MGKGFGDVSKKEVSVIQTLAFFDLFNFPMTAFEIWQSLNIKCSFLEIIDILEGSEYLKVKINIRDGYYYLKDREEAVDIRLKHYHSSDRKFKKAKKFIFLFRLFPWIKMVAMANMIGADNLRDNSDIDLFIITRAKRIWITRFFCVILIKLFNSRPKPGKERDKICLSFFVSEEALEVKDLMLENDIYFKYWLVSLFPIFNSDKTYEKFIRANTCLEDEFPNWNSVVAVKNRRVKRLKNNLYYEMFDLFFGGLDKQARKLQLKILAPGLKERLNKDTRVVMNDRVLKMYAKDRREIYKKRYSNKLKVYKVESL